MEHDNAEKDMEIERLQKEEENLRVWIADLQSGMYVNCVYCGHRYGPEDETPVTMADVLKQHIEVCPEHPMSKLKEELGAAEAERDTFRAILERGRAIINAFRSDEDWCDTGLVNELMDEYMSAVESLSVEPLMDYLQRIFELQETETKLRTVVEQQKRRIAQEHEDCACIGCGGHQGSHERECRDFIDYDALGEE